MKQLRISNSIHFKSTPTFGGEINLQKRKLRRPLDTKRPLHLVLRAETNTPIFLHRDVQPNKLILRMAHRFALKIYENSLRSLIKKPNIIKKKTE
jgi:hypothetical protein